MRAGRPGAPAFVGPDSTTLPRVLAAGDDPGLDVHFRRWGQMPGGGPLLIEEVERAGLRGRGGAAFPTATKLRSVAARGRGIVVANGTEGEPASAKDKALLVSSPHLVLDGVSIAAETVDAGEAIVCVDRSAKDAMKAVTSALAERRAVGADRVPIRVEATPTRYVAGEESALAHWLNGGDAKPTFVPPRPFERGVRGRPTLVNNVETLAQLALIARFGAGWYRGLGTSDDPGTALLTLTGDIPRPGVYEVPFGTPIRSVLRAAGWTSADPPRAVLVGGYSGVWITGPLAAELTVEASSLARAGATLGCGAISVIGPDSCGLEEVAQITWWLADQSAGQCGPCVNGLPAMAEAVDAVIAGDRNPRLMKQLHVWLGMVQGRGACHHPDGVARFVRSALAVFADDIEQHRRHGTCGGGSTSLPLPDPEGGWR